ncbi:MAG: autotransporter domain-containing protein, partial [Rickettsia endosymbiont of Ixodes persulcatus]|nr:autotransporter domain-containing protein [Rickettsia endosymbiont of Ixodes persulcatus]
QLAIACQATLLGGIVNVRLEDDKALLSKEVTEKSLFLKTFNILTASGGIKDSGKFESVWPQYDYITATLDYTAKDVILGFDFTPETKAKAAKKLADEAAEAKAKEIAEAAAKKNAEEEAAKKAEAIRVAEAKRVAKEADDKAAEAKAKQVADVDAKAKKKAELEAAIKTFLSPEFMAKGVKSRNQTSVWKGIQSTGLSPLLSQVAASQSTNPLDFDALSGEVHASLSGVLAADSHFIADAATSRLRSAFGGVTGKAQAVTTPLAYGPEGKVKSSEVAAFAAVEPADATTALWGEAYGSWAHADSDGNASGYSRSTGGFVTGADGVVAESWRLGVLAGYGNTSLRSNGKASVDSYQIGLYGGTKIDALGLRFGASYAHHEIDTRRTVHFGSLSNKHEASYDAGSVQVFGELGRQECFDCRF